MGCMGRRPTFVLMMGLTASFFLVEIIVGYVTNSMALVADSFHMLSDIISLVVGYFALKKTGNLIAGNTFGWVRAEVLGALVNAVFLLALCLSILISALKRLVEPEQLTNPILILIVGGLGLLVNICGIFLFHGHAGGHGHSHGGGGHGHSHGPAKKHSHGGETNHHFVRSDGDGHSHSHGGGGHGHSHGPNKKHSHGETNHHIVKKDIHNTMENGIQAVAVNGTLAPHVTMDVPPSPSMRRFHERSKRVEVILSGDVCIEEIGNVDGGHKEVVNEKHAAKSEGQLNMKGVYLHILGDALGSIIVIISAMIVHFQHDKKWTEYIDPVMSILMVGIILYSSIPLLKESSKILLQNVPPHIQLKQLEARLLSTFPEIIGIHEFHVWQLAGNKIIASVHVKFNSNADYNRLSPNIKKFFHYEGIHSTTFQPEFEEDNEKSLKQCLLACESQSCQEKVCCANNSLDKTDGIELLANGHVIADNNDDVTHNNDIQITVDRESFHMEEELCIEGTGTSTSTICSSQNCLNKCETSGDDELVANKYTEPIDNDDVSIKEEFHVEDSNDSNDVGDSNTKFVTVELSNEANVS